MILKECRENRKTHREVWPFSPLSTTPLWKTSWGSGLYYDFFFVSHILPVVQKIKSCLQDDIT